MEKSPFHLGTIVNFVAIRHYKICLSFCLIICLGYKSLKNLSILTKFGYVLAISNLSLSKKNFMLDFFTAMK